MAISAIVPNQMGLQFKLLARDSLIRSYDRPRVGCGDCALRRERALAPATFGQNKGEQASQADIGPFEITSQQNGPGVVAVQPAVTGANIPQIAQALSDRRQGHTKTPLLF